MREIKFRAWDNKEKEFINSKQCYLNLADGWVFNREIDDGYDDIILMQYTGLKDKNGKEIYEGDIIKDNIYGLVNSVNWHDCYFSCFGAVLGIDEMEGKYLEIIGNIYENPELLNT